MLQLEVSTAWLEHYELRSSREEILEFLKKNPPVVFVLQTVPRQIELSFPDAKLSLELGHDPEIEEWAEYLILSIASTLEIEEAVRRLRQFEMDWWDFIAYSVMDKII